MVLICGIPFPKLATMFFVMANLLFACKEVENSEEHAFSINSPNVFPMAKSLASFHVPPYFCAWNTQNVFKCHIIMIRLLTGSLRFYRISFSHSRVPWCMKYSYLSGYHYQPPNVSSYHCLYSGYFSTPLILSWLDTFMSLKSSIFAFSLIYSWNLDKIP